MSLCAFSNSSVHKYITLLFIRAANHIKQSYSYIRRDFHGSFYLSSQKYPIVNLLSTRNIRQKKTRINKHGMFYTKKTLVSISKRKINNICASEKKKYIVEAEMSTSSDSLQFCMHNEEGSICGRIDSANSDVLWLLHIISQKKSLNKWNAVNRNNERKTAKVTTGTTSVQNKNIQETSAFEAKTARNSKPRNACSVQIDDQRKISQCTNRDEKKTTTTTTTTHKQTNMNKTEISFFHYTSSFLYVRIYHCIRQVQQVCSFVVVFFLRAFALHCTF